MRIGFLFNHDQLHQIAHSLPVALALARSGVDAEIIVATTNPRISAEVIRLGGGLIGREVRLVELGLGSTRSRILANALEAVVPAAKLLVYGDNLDFFRSLDVLVVAEKTSLLLKSRYGLKNLTMVYTGHGAGDRAIGFDRALARFDHVLASGSKIRDRLIRDAGVDPEKLSVVGYPKFDLIAPQGWLRPTGSDGRRAVLYNPHASPHLSSWYRHGREVLDWFLEHDEYDLIFAPHVMLFQRAFVLSIDTLGLQRAGVIHKRHLSAANIHIDLGSRNATTMAYTQRADIYLGDASSQIYEFLLRQRPCVFLNSHGAAWRDDANYAHWRMGPVIETVAGLGEALARSCDDHAAIYRPIQKAMFDHTFDLRQEPSSLRAAKVIARCAGLKWSSALRLVPSEPVGALG